MNKPYCCLLLLVVVDARAEDPPPSVASPQTVVINGGQSDVEASRSFIAGKFIIGKKRITESGVQSVAEILRREPAISVGKDGRIGLLGMPGYTQVLVDGMPPQGLDPYALDLVHVENIEIIKSATAATGPFGVAGTINIIRRKAERKTLAQLRVDGSSTGGRPGANLSWSSNQVASESPLSYSLSLSAGRRTTPSSSGYLQTRGAALEQEFQGERTALSHTDTLLASSDFAWTLNPNHKLRISPDLGRIAVAQDSLEQRRWMDGRSLVLQQASSQPFRSYALPLRWNWQIDPDSRLSLHLNVNRQHLDLDSLASQYWAGGTDRLRRQDQERDTTNRFVNLDFNTEFEGGHTFTAGAKSSRNETSIAYADFINGVPDTSLAALGTSSAIQLDSNRLFAQDDWRLNKSWALGSGVSVEQRANDFSEGTVRNRARYTMWSPSAHVAHKIGGNSKRQVRVSLARTFQPPTMDQMLLHPQINPLAPCDANGVCARNTADTADSAGNPRLQPERALGLNLSYTHGFSANSELAIEFFSRDIAHKIGSELSLENVAWASAPRYVSRPANLGGAKVRGVNLEGRFATRDVWKKGPSLELLGSVGFAHSELSDLPGPDNRLAGQTPWRAKLAGSYAAKDLPLKMNVDANWLPADWVRNNLIERVYQSSKFTLNANANWKVNPNLRLTFSLDNLLPESSNHINEYESENASLRRQTSNAGYARVAVRMEITL